MSRQRIVRDSFWTDSYVERLTPDEKLVFLYLLTNPLCNVAGVYQIRPKRIGFDTGYDVEVIENIIGRLVKDEKLRITGDWIMIINFIKNQSLNPSVEAGITRVLSEMPDSVRNDLGLIGFDIKTIKRSTANFSEAKNREVQCRNCKSAEKLQVDHILPLFAGGNNDLSNLQVLCHECHKTKTQKDFTDYANVRVTGCHTLLNLTLPNSTLPNPTPSSTDDGFVEFWTNYPRKIGKGAAEKSWGKLKPPLEIVISAIHEQKKTNQWSRENGQFIPHPATWLNQKRWEDEVETFSNDLIL